MKYTDCITSVDIVLSARIFNSLRSDELEFEYSDWYEWYSVLVVTL